MTAATNEPDYSLSSGDVKNLVEMFCSLSSGLCNKNNIPVVERYLKQSVEFILSELETPDNTDELLRMSDDELVIKVIESALSKRMLTFKK